MSRVPIDSPPVSNRLRAVLLHVPFYSIDGPSRLASDTGLSGVSISRYINRRTNPSRPVATHIARMISARSGRQIKPGEIFSRTGRYPTPSACTLMDCAGCYPPEAWNETTHTLKRKWRHQKPGEWSHQQASPFTPVSHS